MKPEYEESSGNVFADMELDGSEQELMKAKLILQVHKLLKQQRLTQEQAARRLGTRQPHISALMSLKPVSVSVGRLMEFLTILGQDVEVIVKPVGRGTEQQGRMSVVVRGRSRAA